MTGHAAGLRRLDGIIWLLVAAVAGVEMLAVAFGGFSLLLISYAAPSGTCLALLLAAQFYRTRRNDPNIASALECTAQIIAFAAVAAPLSYVAASAALPLRDANFDAVDRALGFDWKALLAVMERWPAFHAVMRVIYLSMTVQMTAIVLLLGFTGRLAWLRVYTLAFIFAALATIAISTVLPAEGVWLHYGLKSADPSIVPVSASSWPVFLGLRDGSFRHLMAIGSEGIITFPSLHAALAVILIAAFWPVRAARWPSTIVNSLMVMATPIDGSHYLIDVLAGITIAVLCLYAARALVARYEGSTAAAMRDAAPAAAGLSAR
ncbi:MAG TPA: phosphatase PAP2 family protein [Pseudolabrys sp.]